MPSANAGNDMPDTASVMPTRSGQRLRYTADTMPIAMPNSTDHAMLHSVSQNVGMKRSLISVDTGRLVRSERPKSQCATPVMKRTNCWASDLSSPRSWRTSSTVSGVASCPAARRAGSPGSRCTSMKTRNATINSVGRRPSRRLTMYCSIAAGAPDRALSPRGGESTPARRVRRRAEGALLQVDIREIERCVRDHVDAAQLLAVSREQLLDHERRPRRVLPDLLLGVLVQLRLLLLAGGKLRALDVLVHLRILVIRGIEQTRRPRIATEQRTQRPVGLARRGRPADVVQAHRRGLRIGPALDLLDALAGFEQRDLRADADLLQLLLDELRDL